MPQKKRKRKANKDKHAYLLLSGERVSLGWLGEADLNFLTDLKEHVAEGESYFLLLERVRGREAYPLKGAKRLSAEIAQSVLFRVAADIVERVGIRQGVAVRPDQLGDPVRQPLVSVSEAAELIGVSRAAVHLALTNGKLRGYQVGKQWVIKRSVAEAYREARDAE